MSEGMSLQQFWTKLHQVHPMPPDDRPFVCDGSPLACRTMIVGFNPATVIPGPFSQFWDKEKGFLREEFNRAYRASRDGKENGEVSPTRRRLNLLTEHLGPALETNLYSKPTKKSSNLRAKDKSPTPLWFLIDTIRPKLVFAYHAETIRAVQNHFRLDGNLNTLTDVKTGEHRFKLYLCHKFQRSRTLAEGRELAMTLAKQLD